MKREGRLASGKSWAASYSGKNIVRGYAKWYGVNLICAIRELRMLDIPVSAEYEAQVRRSFEDKARASNARKLKNQAEENVEEAHFGFAFIAGYTSGGAPYGISHEELTGDAGEGGESFGEDELPF